MMLKRHGFVLLVAIWLSFTIKAVAQESPLIVTFDRENVSVSEFTNWQIIKLTYTVSYLDGYEFQKSMAEPLNMSFSPFELDPEKGQKQLIANQRKNGNQNHLDLIYYIKHIGEKKGEITIPEQTFYYTRIVAGKAKEGREILNFKSQAVTIKYDNLLPKEPEDIMDNINFGSFKGKALIWKHFAGFGFVVSLVGTYFLIFRNPFRKKVLARKGLSLKVRQAEGADQLKPQEVLKSFLKSLDKHKKGRGEFCNELKDLLIAYAPEVLHSDTTPEIIKKVSKLSDNKHHQTLVVLANWLYHYEEELLDKNGRSDLSESEKQNIKVTVVKLKSYNLMPRFIINKYRQLKSAFRRPR